MTAINNLLSAGLIERDINNDVLWTWSYPSISRQTQQVLMKKCGLENSSNFKHPISFFYCQHKNSCFFLRHVEVCNPDKLPRVKQFVLVLCSKDFHPEKYDALSNILSKVYCKTGNPTAMLQLYLSVLVKGSCSTKENGTFYIKNFDLKTSQLKVPVKDVIKMFGLESILIYTAVILKKRIVAYHHNLETLLDFLRVIPAFIWHRQNWNILYPYMQLTDSDILELQSLQTYAAGFVDAAIEARTDLYDVFINIAATEITVAGHAKELFAMTKTHKDIAVFMTQHASDKTLSHQQVIMELTQKTKELLDTLKTLSSKSNDQAISLSALRENKFHPALENFLWNLAIAEGLIEI